MSPDLSRSRRPPQGVAGRHSLSHAGPPNPRKSPRPRRSAEDPRGRPAPRPPRTAAAPPAVPAVGVSRTPDRWHPVGTATGDHRHRSAAAPGSALPGPAGRSRSNRPCPDPRSRLSSTPPEEPSRADHSPQTIHFGRTRVTPVLPGAARGPRPPGTVHTGLNRTAAGSAPPHEGSARPGPAGTHSGHHADTPASRAKPVVNNTSVITPVSLLAVKRKPSVRGHDQ